MKVKKWAILFAMAGGLSAATAFAQSGLRQPGQVAPAGFEYGSYDYYAAQEPAPSPSDCSTACSGRPDRRSGDARHGCTCRKLRHMQRRWRLWMQHVQELRTVQNGVPGSL
jgi:hypothetical protein